MGPFKNAILTQIVLNTAEIRHEQLFIFQFFYSLAPKDLKKKKVFLKSPHFKIQKKSIGYRIIEKR